MDRDKIESKKFGIRTSHPNFYESYNKWGFYKVMDSTIYMSEVRRDQGSSASRLSYGETNGNRMKIVYLHNDEGFYEHLKFEPSLSKPDSSQNPYLKPRVLAKLRKLHKTK